MSERLAYPGDEAELAAFADRLGFPLDDYQLHACRAVLDGDGVLVAAPTGAGKTVVAEFAVERALRGGGKAFYTTPIKALSNQKYTDLTRRFGAGRVGLLTGDNSIDGDAPVVVMTTEVLRNMLYAGSPALRGLSHVVMDEVHYLADRDRGAVWEEVLLQLPESVQVISLSATVSNAEEFGAWLRDVRGGRTQVVVSEERPVPLFPHLLVGSELYDLFVADDDQRPGTPRRINPVALQRVEAMARAGRGRGGRTTGGWRTDRVEAVRRLAAAALLPGIVFIFSRAGCDAAVGHGIRADLRLIEPQQGARLRQIVRERCADLGSDDLAVLGYHQFAEGIGRGFAAHHAGMLPTFREIVEELFAAGDLQAVFATETLALGINMPARSVVLDQLTKFDGSAHAPLTAGEFTQLTGRAGRRGIDVEGHAVIRWSPGIDPRVVAGLAGARSEPLTSSLRPTANMALNLVARVGREPAGGILGASFAQFQADRSIVGTVRAIARQEEELSALSAQMACQLGDFPQYAGLRAQVRDAEKRRAAARASRDRHDVAESLAELRIGDVIWVPAGRRPGWAVVVQPHQPGHGGGTPAGVVTSDKQLRRIVPADLDEPVRAVTSVRLPRAFNPRSPQSRRDLATTLRIAVSHRDPRDPDAPGSRQGRRAGGRGARGDGGRGAREGAVPAELAALDAEIADLRRRLRAHPCHACPDREEHARVGERWWRLHRHTESLRRNVQGRSESIANTFERICALLAELGYLTADGAAVTPAGQALRRIYTEKDLLTAQLLHSGALRGLDPAELAAVIATVIHEPRGDEPSVTPRPPTARLRTALDAMTDLWAELVARERAHGLPATPRPDPALAEGMHRWAKGAGLASVLLDADLSAGDFVRRCKQVADVLGQLVDAARAGGQEPVAKVAAQARDLVVRGVVAADRLD